MKLKAFTVLKGWGIQWAIHFQYQPKNFQYPLWLNQFLGAHLRAIEEALFLLSYHHHLL